MALSNLYFLASYNNYYNREIKYQETVDDYLDAVMATSRVFGYNFNIADQVNTSIIINADEITGNYLVVEDQTKDNIVASRWFILETVWLRQGQFRISLRRDLIADFLKPLLTATVYVEKGWVRQNTTGIQNMNPLIFNQESFTANQIKINEVELKDKSRCKWIVGYVNKNSLNPDAGQTNKEYTTYTNKAATPDFTKTTIAQSPIGGFLGTPRRYVNGVYVSFDVITATQHIPSYRRYTVNNNNASYVSINRSEYTGTIQHPQSTAYFRPFNETEYEQLKSGAKIFYNEVYSSTWQTALAANGKILHLTQQDGDVAAGYYRIKIDITPTNETTSLSIDPNVNVEMYNVLENYIEGTGSTLSKSGLNFKMKVAWSGELTASLEPIYNEGYKITIDQDRNRTINEAFDAFAIPVLEERCFFYGTDDNGTEILNAASADYNSAFAIAQELVDIQSEVLDLQLLPYCPLPADWIQETDQGNVWFKMPQGTYNKAWNLIWGTDGSFKNVLFHLSTTEFSNVISYNDPCDYSSIEEIKAINQCDTWRLYSGDYSSSFEFNIARNGGIAYFEIDCKYKPYQPYIHIAPNFGGLYGTDYDDTRGLICSNTNFSLPRLTNAWSTYERNNLNYMNAFNRQIKNMNVQRNYQKLQEGVGLGVGVLQGAGTGAYMGSIGGPWGIAAGAALGAAGAIGGGIADWYVSDQLYKENKQYAIDQFNMSLQNIQALPDTLAAVGAQNPNNKVFPVLCFYSCSAVEREAFKKKIKWDGMKIGVISESIGDYINPNAKTYFKGQLIYMTSAFYDTTNQTTLRYDPHEMAELANELAKGILIDKGVID